MVHARPKSKLEKFPDGTRIDLSPEKLPPRTRALRRVKMEKKSPTKPNAVESLSALDGVLLADFATGVEEAPNLHDIHMEVDDVEEEAEHPLPEKTPKKEYEKKKEGPSSAGKKKTKETPTASSSRKRTADSSHTESTGTETKAAKDKEVSEEGSSGDALGEDKEEVNDQAEDDEDDDVQVVKERPAKRSKMVTSSSRRGKSPTVSAKELVKNKEVVVPKRLEYALIE